MTAFRGPLAFGLALALSACHSLDTRPPRTPVPLAGHWREDVGASDDFDQKVGEAVATERARMQPRQPQMSGPGGQAGTVAVPALPPPRDMAERERRRLSDDLRPAAELRIAFVDDAIEITRDAEPVRRFRPGQTVSRIDSSGAANVSNGWDQRAFVIEARYTDHATRTWRLEIDAPTDTLHVRFQADDPEFGHVVIQTVYRRAP
jgi:hypothetical protein